MCLKIASNRSFTVIFFLIILLLPFYGFTQGSKKASKNEISRARYYLDKMEKRVKRMRGQNFKMGYEGKEALKRIKALKEKYPDDPAVESLFQRARASLMKSKGDFVQITPKMLEYRKNEKKMKKLFADIAKKEWEDYKKSVLSSPHIISKPFPPVSYKDKSIDEMIGKYLILDNFEFPTNEFTDTGRQFVYIGSPTRGYYYVDLSGRPFLGPYEAVKRYRRQVNHDVPEGGKWTIIGRITGLELLVPQAGKKKIMNAYYGWNVEPMAIYVPERTFAVYNRDLELGGEFSGERNMGSIKAGFYSINSIPKNVTPERLVKIFSIAIKEKNYKLYLACIDPARKKTKTALSRIMYHWELHQNRFAKFYVHVVLNKAKINVIKGYDSSNKTEEFFLSDKQKKTIKKFSGMLWEEAFVTSQAFDERGRQYGSPKPHFLKRIDKKRWYITNYPQPF